MKENDFQKYLCERLVKIKSQNPTLYEKAIDVLSFIYKDVRKKFIYGELEKDGLINRIVYPVVPPKTEYSLTDFGQTLAPILDAMCDWGNDYLKR